MRFHPNKPEKRRRAWTRRRKVHYSITPSVPQKRNIPRWRFVLYASLTVLSLAIIAFASNSIIRSVKSYRESREEYASYRVLLENEAQEKAQLDARYTLEENEPKNPIPTNTPLLWTPAPVATVFLDYNYHLIRLQEKNRDLIGWINIPGTVIDYPIVQTTNNHYYMEHTFAKRENPGGTIFMDYRGDPAFLHYVTVIYGHHMKDGSMFSALRQYRNIDFLRSNQRVKVETLAATYEYQVFAAFYSEKNDDFLYYNQNKEGIRQELNSYLMKKSGNLIGQVAWPREIDHILIMTTCDYGNAQGDFWTVAAYRISN